MIRKLAISVYIICLIFTFTFIIISCGNISTQNDIYGVWEGKNSGNKYTFKFNPDGTCEIKIKDSISNLIEILNGNFTMDYSKIPIPLSIKNIPQLDHPIHTVVEILGPDSLRMGFFSPRWKIRNITFEKNKTTIFKKINLTK